MNNLYLRQAYARTYHNNLEYPMILSNCRAKKRDTTDNIYLRAEHRRLWRRQQQVAQWLRWDRSPFTIKGAYVVPDSWYGNPYIGPTMPLWMCYSGCAEIKYIPPLLMGIR